MGFAAWVVGLPPGFVGSLPKFVGFVAWVRRLGSLVRGFVDWVRHWVHG